MVPDATLGQVAEALRQSAKVVDVSDDGKQVKRKLPLPSLKDIAIAVDSRSIYARPFRFDSQLDTVQVGCGAGCGAGRHAGRQTRGWLVGWPWLRVEHCEYVCVVHVAMGLLPLYR